MLLKKTRYFVNDLLARNTLWQISVLVVVSVVIVLTGVILVGNNVEHGFWWSFTRLLDQGTFVGDDRYDRETVLVGVFITLWGILILSLLVGILSSKITAQLSYLKRGRSPVVERGHIIVCGEGDRLYEVTRELVTARNEGSFHGRVVIFSGRSREEMEETLQLRLGGKDARRVICRSGDTTDVDSLSLPGFNTCAGFVVVGERDMNIVKTLVAVSSLAVDKTAVGVCEIRNRSMGWIAGMAYHGVVWVPSREVVMRLLVQVGRQPGLSAVYSEILSFSGSEFYLIEKPDLAGCTFGEISTRISEGIAVGISSGETVNLNPPLSMPFGKRDRLLVLAEDLGAISFAETPLHDLVATGTEMHVNSDLRRLLILSGQSRKFAFMIGLLDGYSSPGTELTVAGSIGESEGAALLCDSGYSNCTVKYIRTERTDRNSLRALHPEQYDSIIVISGKTPLMTDEDADSECIVTLLILRELAERFGKMWNATVVSEIRNPKNRRLATASGIDDFIISNEISSMIMAQLVVQKGLRTVYEEIFDPSGCEIQLRGVSSYHPGNFSSLVVQGLERREIVLGWITGSGPEAGAVLNPGKADTVPTGQNTRIVVIAER